jgi:polysaccharide export outer membrane protein
MGQNAPKIHGLVLALLGAVLISSGAAQKLSSAPASASLPPSADASTSPLKVNGDSVYDRWVAEANRPYQIGRGDEISVVIANRPELSGKQIVGPDGKITLSIAGSLVVAGLTREEAAAAIGRALSSYYSNVSVSVGVDTYASDHLFVLGAVEHPGEMTFTQTPTLLEIISRAGVQNASDKAGAAPEQCMIYRGAESVVWVDLRELLTKGRPNLPLMRDDVVYVPSAKDQFVSVMGQVVHPGTEELHSTSTLAQLLADAGGITEKAGRNPQISITQPSSERTIVVSYKDVIAAKPLDLHLQSGDVIVVSESGFNRAAYTMEKVSPLLTIITFAALLGN